MNINGKFPRDLTERERNWILWMLPEDKPGYRAYREMIKEMMIIGYGRFEPDNLILGQPNDKPDEETFFTPIISLGQIEMREARIQISIHREHRNQIQVDIVNLLGDTIPENVSEIRRWSYAYWNPGDVSPCTEKPVREVKIFSRTEHNLILVISPSDKKIWLHEIDSGINYIIPVTNFFNELLRQRKEIIDKTGGLNVNFIFENIDRFSDADINNAFINYSKIFAKVDVGAYEEVKEKKGLFSFLKRKTKK
ncbi:MAG: hypothetical protein RMJ81_09920 [Candidatus Kryptonium sp.]|nr:hypothetical protein [Candidatus Kryptonium sp.]MCX7763038.1 hypothetical protein [Candidatus Kryptonium sp.]MDW8109951.1 hypothetical protein [Candidatus Kryptonium sp.]